MSPTRRLAAIAVADVVGYSRLMEADEAGTMAALQERWTLILEPMVGGYGGRVVKFLGDGALIEFTSAVSAVEAALAVQAKFTEANAGLEDKRRIMLRIGINLGDVIGEGSDIFGEGVNIAARLEPLAESGGVCVSAKIHAEVSGKVATGFTDLGEQQLKNIATPVRAFRSVAKGAAEAPRPAIVATAKPSIAVLAFQNMSGDIEQEYFADGVVEDIITALSRMHGLFVIARNSSFSYKGRLVDVKQIGRELGVRYVLEGSIRRAGGRVRITAQLINAATGAHLWAERYDGAVEDVFDLQDQVTASVVGAIAPKLELAEIELARRKPTTSLDAYDHYLRGLASLQLWTFEGGNEALKHFYRAIELDPGYAAAYGLAARTISQRKVTQVAKLEAADIAEAERLSRRAVELGRTDDIALSAAGITMGFVVGDIRGGMALTERALALNPNLAHAWYSRSWMQTWDGQFGAAIESARRAMELSPQDHMMFQMQSAMAHAHFAAARYDEALAWAERALHDRSTHLPALWPAAASLAMLGRQTEAENHVERILRIAPAMNQRHFHSLLPFVRAEDLARWIEALRLAGLPE